MTTSTKGPAFEIRFCEGNKVQVYDLSKKGQHVLPSEYQEDDVAKGRLRYSKLGNQSIVAKQNENDSDDDDDDNYKSMNTTTTTISNINKENMGLNVIPVVAKQKALQDQKELESIRQAEEAVRKAMERKQKIERARIARQKALAEAEGQQQQSSGTMNDDNNHNDSMEINRKEDVPQLSPQPSYQSVKKINKEHTIITDMNIKEKSDNTMTVHQPSTPVPQQQQQHQQHYYQQYNNNDKYKHHDQNISSSSLPSSITPLPTSLSSPPQSAAAYYNKASYPTINHHHQQQSYSYQSNINNNINNNYDNMNMNIPPKVQNEEYPSFFHQDMDDHKKKNSCCCIIS